MPLGQGRDAEGVVHGGGGRGVAVGHGEGLVDQVAVGRVPRQAR